MKEIKHLTDTIELSKKEILDIFNLIKLLKEAHKLKAVPKLLKGASLAMIFEEPSTRTRISFEVAMAELGGHALYLKPGEIHFGSHEGLSDMTKVISSMCDGIIVRAKEHETVLNIAKYSSVPVFNGMTYYNHPTQGICDFFTMTEHLPKGKELKDLNIVFVGDSSNVGIMAMETGHMCAALGLNYTVASPKKYSMIDSEIKLISKKMEETGGSLTVTEDVDSAVLKADFIIPDVWWYYGYEDEKEDRLAAFYPKYQLNMDMLRKAPNHCKALHCLPASRDNEITSEVMDHPTRSIVFEEAENRLHTQRGLLAWYLYDSVNKTSNNLSEYYTNLSKHILESRNLK